ncbi:hypothetical protein CIB84_009888, partial [Bambusicola thoracicus]
LQWILDKQDLLKERQKDLKFLSEEEYWKLQIFFTNGSVVLLIDESFYVCETTYYNFVITFQIFPKKYRSSINGSYVCVFGIQSRGMKYYDFLM